MQASALQASAPFGFFPSSNGAKATSNAGGSITFRARATCAAGGGGGKMKPLFLRVKFTDGFCSRPAKSGF